jgi:hypothetical protein
MHDKDFPFFFLLGHICIAVLVFLYFGFTVVYIPSPSSMGTREALVANVTPLRV